MGAYGIEPADVLQMATVNAASALGVDDRGIIAPGKRADIIAANGNPLENISTMERVHFVMRAGDIRNQEP